jgi:hypothetical protein
MGAGASATREALAKDAESFEADADKLDGGADDCPTSELSALRAQRQALLLESASAMSLGQFEEAKAKRAEADELKGQEAAKIVERDALSTLVARGTALIAQVGASLSSARQEMDLDAADAATEGAAKLEELQARHKALLRRKVGAAQYDSTRGLGLPLRAAAPAMSASAAAEQAARSAEPPAVEEDEDEGKAADPAAAAGALMGASVGGGGGGGGSSPSRRQQRQQRDEAGAAKDVVTLAREGRFTALLEQQRYQALRSPVKQQTMGDAMGAAAPPRKEMLAAVAAERAASVAVAAAIAATSAAADAEAAAAAVMAEAEAARVAEAEAEAVAQAEAEAAAAVAAEEEAAQLEAAAASAAGPRGVDLLWLSWVAGAERAKPGPKPYIGDTTAQQFGYTSVAQRCFAQGGAAAPGGGGLPPPKSPRAQLFATPSEAELGVRGGREQAAAANLRQAWGSGAL